MNKNRISIRSIASISPLGISHEEIWKHYQNSNHHIVKSDIGLISKIPPQYKEIINALQSSDLKYKSLDNSVLYAIYAARSAVKHINKEALGNMGINIGSSRGATSVFEKYHKEFISTQKTSTLSSPTTTLGNISSWIAHDLQVDGPVISHSITCSTALHALLNGIAWINSGMSDTFLVGGSEAPLTPFTISQMQAMKIYAKEATDYPCKAYDLEKNQNTMVLGEGAAVALLEKGVHENSLGEVLGVGYATEPLRHNVSISANADCFQKSMKMALSNAECDTVDVVVMHAPGTIKGDQSEYNAIKKVFGKEVPALTTNKWKIGHTFGASGMLSIEMALLMLKHKTFINVPYAEVKMPQKIERIMVNAVGFGGNAVSILLKR